MSIPVAKLMKQTGCKLGLVIHDPVNFPGPRLRDRIRHTSQYLVMRILTRIADETIVPIPLASVPWIGGQGSSRVHSIPVGSNVGHSTQRDGRSESDMFTIAVFGLTEGDKREVRNIAEIVTKVAGQVGQVRLVLLGRGSSEAKPLLDQLFSGTTVHLVVLGVLPAGDVGSRLGSASASLFIRGGISARRGSAVAAIAYGVPVVAYIGVETGWPLTAAGGLLIANGDTQAMTQAFVRLAKDRDWAETLRARSHLAFNEHFAWDRIAARFEEVFLN